MKTALVVAAVCLALEAFFSGSEIAVISADRIKIRQGVGMSARARALLQRFLGTPQRLLATTLIGTQIAVVTSTVTLTLALADHRAGGSGEAELLVLLGLTPILVIFGEIVPKSFAQQHADRLAPILVYPLRVASIVFAPAVAVAGSFTGWVARVLGLETTHKLVSREDLELIVKGDGGQMSDGERKMISRIFDFGERTAYDMMVPLSSVVALNEATPLDEVVRFIEEHRFTRFPVYRDRIDRIVGIVHSFAVFKAGHTASTVGEVMNPPIYAPENQPAVDLLVRLQRQRQGMAVVVDEYGGAVGVVTIEDILEEIVGEIEDEYDVGPTAIRKEAEGLWRVRATMPIAEVNRQLKVDLPEGEDYETLAGLVLDKLKHIPRPGETVRFPNLILTVTAASERAVDEVQLRLQRRRTRTEEPRSH
jgi:putative hemolysin